jgi:hypothetical protein
MRVILLPALFIFTSSACAANGECDKIKHNNHLLFLANDTDHDGKLSFEEFRRMDEKSFEIVKRHVDLELIKAQFKQYDINNDGFITEGEFNGIVLRGLKCELR